MDEDYNLLDYEEGDLDIDMHTITTISNSQDNDFKLAEKVIKTSNDSNVHPPNPVSPDNLEIEFFFANNTGCPIDGCSVTKFVSKAKYMRHWNEKHIPTSIKYCSVRRCTVTCRRRYDMKIHIRNVHRERDPVHVEEITSRCGKTVMENRGYINPGFFIFKGRISSTSSSAVSTPVSSTSSSLSTSTYLTASASSPALTSASSFPCSTVSVPSNFSTATKSSCNPSVTCHQTVFPGVSVVISTALSSPSVPLLSDNTDFQVIIPPMVSPSVTSSLSGHRISLGDYRLREKSQPVVSDIRAFDYSSSFGIRATTDRSSQTTSLELPPVVLPDIPDQQDVLEAYIRWLCLGMDQFGRQREAAKQRLGGLRRNRGRLEKERELRQALEAENRKLKREVTEAKWRDKYLFPES